MQDVELLSPAGDIEAGRAAILAGANAIYLGLDQFNARKRATNLSLADLSELATLAHSYKCKIFITLNVLLTESELETALDMAKAAIYVGADAIILQDVGFLALVKEIAPEIEVHASTQMTLHNKGQLDFIANLGASQVNYLRELSLDELSPLMRHAHNINLKNELFVHGAFCLSCSGICYMSGHITAQPGNRGACVQPCRRGYSLTPKGNKVPYLNLKDNTTIEMIPEMVKAGADTFKIEGRIKDYRYVYEATKAYRAKIDEIASSSPQNHQSSLKTRLNKIFNRDLSINYLKGNICNDQFQESSRDQSLKYAGTVGKFSAKFMEIEINSGVGLKAGDTLAVYGENSFAAKIRLTEKRFGTTFKVQILDVLKGKIYPGDSLFLYPTFENESTLLSQIRRLASAKQGIEISLSGSLNQPLVATFKLGQRVAIVQSNSALLQATGSGFNHDSLFKSFSRLGDTSFALEKLDCDGVETGLFLPIKELNEMRRLACDELQTQLAGWQPETNSAGRNKANPHHGVKVSPALYSPFGKFCILTNEITDLNLLDPDELIFIPLNGNTHTRVYTNRIRPWIGAFILETQVQEILNKIKEIPEGVVVCENAGVGFKLGQLGIPWVAGPQLNITNSKSLNTYAEFGGAIGGVLSLEINREQQLELLKATKETPRSGDGVNPIRMAKIFGPLLLMTTRQCLYSRVKGCPQGKTKKDSRCLHGCQQEMTLFDERDIALHFAKQKGGYTEIYNDALLSVPEAVNQLPIDHFLLDFREFEFFRPTTEEKAKFVQSMKMAAPLETLRRLTRGSWKKRF